RLRQLARRCWSEVEGNVVWKALAEAERQRMRAQARQQASRWVRSSSCVEGRNGALRLRQHGKGGLSQQELGALTVLHNYWVKRTDGSTAAGRFFGQEPEDLFEWLRARFLELPRRARSRRQAA